jgi:hypothetical protein
MGSLPDAERPVTFQGVIRRDEGRVRSHVDQVVRESVEQTLNGLFESEADGLCRAGRYECSPDRLDTRAGHDFRQRRSPAGPAGRSSARRTGPTRRARRILSHGRSR